MFWEYRTIEFPVLNGIYIMSLSRFNPGTLQKEMERIKDMRVVKCCLLCKIWPLYSWNSDYGCLHRNYTGQCTSIFSHRLKGGSLKLPLFRQLWASDGWSGRGSLCDRVNSELLMLQLTQEAPVKLCGAQNIKKTKQDKKNECNICKYQPMQFKNMKTVFID